MPLVSGAVMIDGVESPRLSLYQQATENKVQTLNLMIGGLKSMRTCYHLIWLDAGEPCVMTTGRRGGGKMLAISPPRG